MTIDATTPVPAAEHAVAPGEAVIGAYRPERASLFASRRGVPFAEGVARRATTGPAMSFAEQMAELLRGEDGAPVALGAIPFDPNGRGYLVRPRAVRRGAPLAHRTKSPDLPASHPELLVSRTGDAVHAHPLAGSTRRARDPAQDALLRNALLRSEKDRREHAIVVEAVAASLRPFCAGLDVPAEPEAIATSTMWHLGTRLTGRLVDPSNPASELAETTAKLQTLWTALDLTVA